MKLSALLFLFSIALFSCSNQPDCSNLKTGVFKIETQNNGTIIVTRTETQSIESMPGANMKMTNRIEWTDECKFTITYDSGDKPSSPSADLPVDCEIVEVGPDYHIVRAKIRGSEMEVDYRMENQ